MQLTVDENGTLSLSEYSQIEIAFLRGGSERSAIATARKLFKNVDGSPIKTTTARALVRVARNGTEISRED